MSCDVRDVQHRDVDVASESEDDMMEIRAAIRDIALAMAECAAIVAKEIEELREELKRYRMDQR